MSTTLEASDPDVPATYRIGWHDRLVEAAERRADVSAGQFLRYPNVDTGFYYEVTTAGRLAQHYPTRIPRAGGQTVQDGSAVLTARHPDDATLVAISSAVWTIEAGLTLDSQSESGFFTSITVSGGVDGEDYECTCRMTPSSGNAIEQTIIIPRRAQ